MYSALVVLAVLTVAVSAGPAKPEKSRQGPEPRKCCAAPYYTYKQFTVATSLKNGGLLTDLIEVPGAYDSIEKKISMSFNVHISNGTVEVFKLIADYNEGKAYVIYETPNGTQCDVVTFSYPFPYNCLPEDSTYVGAVTIGDRALKVANWYHNDKTDPSEDSHVVYTVEEDGCVDVGVFVRTFDPETGDEISVARSSFSDYSLGICDPDKWFKVPEFCKASNAVEGIPAKIAKIRGPGGKRLFP